MSEPAIKAVDVSKRFGTTVAVRSLNLEIGENEFFSLLGPSGCGKTTFLRMIAGFEKPTSGSLLIGGQEMKNVPPHKRPVNMVFQSYALFPHLSVFDNVAFGLRSAGKIDAATIGERVNEALNLVRLKEFGERFPSEISGGQQQRVALARAIVNRPKVLLLDEPLSALDAQIREEMQLELARLKNELNLTFVMVTHDQDEALALSTRVAVFHQGNLEQVGKPIEIYESPQTTFVARFIGNTNLIEGKIAEAGDDFAVVEISDGSRLSVKAPSGGKGAPGSTVWVSAKPNVLQITAAGDDITSGAHPNSFVATVKSRSYLGAQTDFTLLTKFGAELKVSRASENGHAPQVGDSVLVTAPADGCSYLIGGEEK